MQFLDVTLRSSGPAACAFTHRVCLLTLDSNLQGHGKADSGPAQSANYNPAVKQFSVCQMNKQTPPCGSAQLARNSCLSFRSGAWHLNRGLNCSVLRGPVNVLWLQPWRANTACLQMFQSDVFVLHKNGLWSRVLQSKGY